MPVTAGVLVLGGYGTFGRRIVEQLVNRAIPVTIAGRNQQKAQALQQSLNSKHVSIACFNAHTELEPYLITLKPSVVINTCGPFQNCNYSIAKICINQQVPYIDLADSREFIAGLKQLDAQAKAQNIPLITGASTVPALSSAVLKHFEPEFQHIDRLRYGISTGQRTERGLATTKAILSYLGKPIKTPQKTRYGWQGLYRQSYPELGKRWMANCNIPDYDLLPDAYGLKDMQFSAGLEVPFLHLGLWSLSWLGRLGVNGLPKLAKPLLAASKYFDAFGTSNSGMHMLIYGQSKNGQALTKQWFIIAKDGQGLYIPTVPAILLAEQLYQDTFQKTGAMVCTNLISLEDYLTALKPYNISVTVQ